MSALRDAETSECGYSLTGNEAFLEPYLAVRDTIASRLQEVRRLTSISAAQKHLDALAPLIDAKMAGMSRVIELRRTNDMIAVQAAVGSGVGKRLMDSIRAKMSSFIQLEKNALAHDDADVQSNLQYLFAVIVSASLLLLFLPLSFVYTISRHSHQRLTTLVHLETQHLLANQEETNRQLVEANVTLQVSEAKLAVTLNSIGDAVIAPTPKGSRPKSRPSFSGRICATRCRGTSTAGQCRRPNSATF